MSLGLSFDSKPTKVPKKVIIVPKYKFNKIMRFKKCQRVQKVKESRYTGSVLHLSWSWEGWCTDTETQNLRGSNAFCAPCPREGASAREGRFPPMEAATVNQAMSR